MLWSSNDVTQQGSRPKTKLAIELGIDAHFSLLRWETNRVIGNGPNIPGKFRVSKDFRNSLREKSLSSGEKLESIASLYEPSHVGNLHRADYRATGCVGTSTLSHAIALRIQTRQSTLRPAELDIAWHCLTPTACSV